MEKKVIFKQLNEKTTRTVLTYGDSLMLVEFCFKKGGVGEPHRHPDHEQAGYIASGSFEVICGEEKKILKKGDTYFADKNVLHGVVALEDDSIIIDSFTPIRKDFLE